jgi:stage II sporulation protein D
MRLLAVLAVLLVVPAPAPALVEAAAAGPVAASGCPSPGGGTVATATAPAGAELVVRGHGWGHSTGLSQYGAQGAARLGCTYPEILSTYYRGTSVHTKTLAGAVDVTLVEGGTSAQVTATSRSVPWRGPYDKAAEQPAGATWSVLLSGSSAFLRDSAGRNVFSVSAGQTLRAVQNGRAARVRSFDGSTVATDRTVRWDETRFVSSSSGLRAVQAIRTSSVGPAVQKYLWGLAEVPSSWPAQALRAQAVAARSYLVRRWRSDRGAYVVWATTRDQNYGGYLTESADYQAGGHWKAAVEATPSRVVLDGAGSVIDALYSSSHGGRSEDVRYSFGGDAVPYLTTLDDSRWDLASDNPYRSWAAGFSAASLAGRFGLDTVTDLTVGEPGTAERLAGIRVSGTVGGRPAVRTYTGMQARTALGLRSPGVTFAWVRRPLADHGYAISGDWDGDGRADVGWFKDGVFRLRWPDGSQRAIGLGRSGDTPVVGDWNADGRDGIGVFRSGTWSLRNSLAGVGEVTTFGYGQAGDRAVVGRWSSASPVGIGVVRGDRWLLRRTADQGPAEVTTTYPGTGRPLLGAWTGGTAKPGWVSAGTWSLSSGLLTPRTWRRLSFGRGGDDYLVGDWAGRGFQAPGVARSSSFFWRTDLLGGPPTGSLVFAP